MIYKKSSKSVNIKKNYIPLVAHFLVFDTHKVTFAESLELRDDLGQSFITHVFKFSHDTGTEEDFGVTDTVF